MIKMLRKIMNVHRWLALLKAYFGKPDFTAKGRLYLGALTALNTEASPNDLAPDELGCAETVNAIHKKVFGFEIGGNLSTNRMYKALNKSPLFLRIDNPSEGDLVISPTGFGNGNLPNGHVGIVSKDRMIMSNDSATGLFLENYSLDTWKGRYAVQGGYPVCFFRRI